MFNFSRGKTASDFVQEAKDTYGLPEQKPMWSVPPEQTETKEDAANVFYRFGITDQNRVAFQMGYKEITLNKQGCREMIEELTFFMNRLEDDTEEE